MVFCGNQYKGAGFPETSTYHKLRTGQRPWPTKEIPCVIRPSGQCAKPGRSSGSPMGTGNSYGRLQKTNQVQRFIIRVVSCRKDGNRNYVKPGEAVWLYARRYEDGTIKYFVSNAPDHISYT
ncbi:MAG: hypothetical protein ACLTAG_00310 [Mediterraneibacter gnavus]